MPQVSKTQEYTKTIVHRNDRYYNPGPICKMGIDILGPFLPTSWRRKYLFVGMDYFTKWVEVEAMQTISEENVKQFIFRNIICRFRVPLQIITDNGVQFT